MHALRPAPLAQMRAAPRLQRNNGRVSAVMVASAGAAAPRRVTALRAVRADGPSAEVVRARLLLRARCGARRRCAQLAPAPTTSIRPRAFSSRALAQDLNKLAQLKQNGEDRFTALCMEGYAGAAGAEPDANSGLRRQVRAALELLETGLLERETEVRLLLLAALAGEHLLLLGAQPRASRRTHSARPDVAPRRPARHRQVGAGPPLERADWRPLL